MEQQYKNFQVSTGEQLQVLASGLKVVTLNELKAQMHIDECIDAEDSLIITYGIAAEDQVIGMTRRSLEDLSADGKFPAPLKVAVLMFAAHLYRNREPVATGATPAAIPYTLETLVKPFVKLSDR